MASSTTRHYGLDNPVFIQFCHPSNKEIFLVLPKNDLLPGTSGMNNFGVYHETAHNACQIVACNEPGSLSTSAERNDTDARVSPEQHKFLTSNKYYYHVTQSANVNYSICIEFASWPFPHGRLPSLWVPETPLVDDAGFQINNGTEMSARIKERDKKCRVSGWVDNRTTAHVIPAAQRPWMIRNDMLTYAATTNVIYLDRDPRNLFALRWDIYTCQFDSGNLVIVPMDGEMVTHFIGASHESASLYHNKPFDTTNLSGQFLFARFAWAIIKNAQASFKAHSAVIQKTFTLKTLSDEKEVMGSLADDEDEDNSDGQLQKKKGKKRKRSELKDPAARDAHELNEDIAMAKRVAPFFLEPEGIAKSYAYKNMMCILSTASLKGKNWSTWMDAHPNIRACTGPCALPNTDSEGTIESD